MKILILSSGHFSDLVSINLMYNNLLKVYNNKLHLDILFTEKQSQSIYFNECLYKNLYHLKLRSSNLSVFRELKKNNYKYIFCFSNNVFYRLLLRSLNTEIISKNNHKLRKSYFDLTNYFSYAKEKSFFHLDNIPELKRPYIHIPIISVDNNMYRKAFEIVNWSLKSSQRNSLTKNRFCFLYLNSKFIDNQTVKTKLSSIMEKLKNKNIEILIVLGREFNLKIDDLGFYKTNFLIDNFSYNNKNVYLKLFFEYAHTVMTDDESLALECHLKNKQYTFLNLNKL
ncbi:hypothetical protein [Psychroflexus planctonicus]|uniref:Uncharacterized protein n=1 Tax=Psychroflexus planctonicus TaxID=1526575 RepID=A0ABQ1SKA2_9FLAO|nr:hypothetical protein [Psychroflexus planctonicus]GGE40911.1 hypothetical protein GCM10010832_21230 [Psychroflexus planctonicus]